jgi:hypothetical protein
VDIVQEALDEEKIKILTDFDELLTEKISVFEEDYNRAI